MTTYLLSLLVPATLHRRGGALAARALPCLGFPALLWSVLLVVGEAMLPLVSVPIVEVMVLPVEVFVPPAVLVGEAMR